LCRRLFREMSGYQQGSKGGFSRSGVGFDRVGSLKG
jgi:hypothetical protein